MKYRIRKQGNLYEAQHSFFGIFWITIKNYEWSSTLQEVVKSDTVFSKDKALSLIAEDKRMRKRSIGEYEEKWEVIYKE